MATTITPTLRPYLAHGGYRRPLIAVVLLVAVGIAAAREIGIPVVLIAAGAGLLIIANLALRRITLGDNEVVYRGWLLRRVALDPSETTVIDLARYLEFNYGVVRRILLVDRSGRARVSLVAAYWRAEDLDALVGYLRERDAEVVHVDDPTDTAGLMRNHPGMLGLLERRPGTVALITCAALFAMVAVGTLLDHLDDFS